MTGKDLDDVERSLARLAPKAVPPGLRQRVMASVLEARENAVLTPRMRAFGLAWAVVAFVAVTGDAVVSNWQSRQIAASLGGPGVSAPAEGQEEFRLQWAEVGGDLGDLDKFLREGIVQSRLGSRGGSGRGYLEAREWLKGMIDHEDPENYH
jgi:hypothetical protein